MKEIIGWTDKGSGKWKVPYPMWYFKKNSKEVMINSRYLYYAHSTLGFPVEFHVLVINSMMKQLTGIQQFSLMVGTGIEIEE